MPLTLSILGLSTVMVGTVLLYKYQDPSQGHHLMLESFDPVRERRGARTGLAFIAVGTIIQVIAVIVGG